MRFPIAFALAVAVALFASSAQAQEEPPPYSEGVPVHRYMVSTSHTPDQCLSALDEMAAKKKRTLSKMQWGCSAGDHTGYMFVDATDKDAALSVLPESARGSAKVVEVTKFTPKQLRAIHAKMAAPPKGDAPAKK